MKENLEKILNGLDEEIQEFKAKEISKDMTEVYSDKKLLEDITKRILECQKEAQSVNNEEELLGLFIQQIITDFSFFEFIYRSQNLIRRRLYRQLK